MERGAGSFIRNKAGELEENLKDPVMKKRKEIREKKEKKTPPLNPPFSKGGTKGGVDSGLPPETKESESGETKKRPADESQAKAEIIAAMAQIIISGENLISGGRPEVKVVEEILGYQISAGERDNLMKEVIADVS